MIKKSPGIFAAIFSALCFADEAVPPSSTAVKPSAELRTFKRSENWDHLFEVRWAPDKHSNFRSIGLSSRYKFSHNLMVGVYIQRTWGELHFHNWVRNPADGIWKWQDVDSTTETHYGLLAQKKWVLTDTLGVEFRANFEHHKNNEMDLIRLRPGLNWLAHPSWMTYARYEIYIPRDVDVTSLYKQGIYLGALYTATPPLLLGPFVRWEQKTWWTSPQFSQLRNDTYRVKDDTISLGISIIYNL